jgi:hypothetical protein
MGWKTSAILIDRPLGMRPEELVQRLVEGPASVVRTVSIEEAFYPSATFVSEHGGSTIILDPKWPGAIVELGTSAILTKLLETFADANIVALQLHSVTNYAGFRVFRSGKSVRAFMVAADDGVIVDEGEHVDAELRVLSKHTRRALPDGQPCFVDNSNAEWKLDQLGEEIVFELFRDFFGERPDEGDLFIELPVTEVAHAQPKKGFWQKLFG